MKTVSAQVYEYSANQRKWNDFKILNAFCSYIIFHTLIKISELIVTKTNYKKDAIQFNARLSASNSIKNLL